MKKKKNKNTLSEEIEDMERCFEENEYGLEEVERFNRLQDDEKRMILVYLYYGNFTGTAKHFNCSSSWMGRKIRKILDKLR